MSPQFRLQSASMKTNLKFILKQTLEIRFNLFESKKLKANLPDFYLHQHLKKQPCTHTNLQPIVCTAYKTETTSQLCHSHRANVQLPQVPKLSLELRCIRGTYSRYLFTYRMYIVFTRNKKYSFPDQNCFTYKSLGQI